MFILVPTAHTYARGIQIVQGNSTNVESTAKTNALIYVHFFVTYSRVGFAHLGIANETHLPYQKKSLISINHSMIANIQIMYFTVDMYFKKKVVLNNSLCIQYIIAEYNTNVVTTNISPEYNTFFLEPTETK